MLPAFTILITSIGGWILTMRNNMITVVAEDYVKMARAKGLKPRRILWQYAGRNALLPNLTGFAMSLGFVISGAILVEYVFNYPGVGFLLLQAVENEDYPLMQALFLLITVAVLVAIFISDVATALLDPRTRSQPMRAAQRRRAGPVRRRGASCCRDKKALVGSIIMLILLVIAAFPSWFTPDDPAAEIYNPGDRALVGAPPGHDLLRPGRLLPTDGRHAPVGDDRPRGRLVSTVLSVVIGLTAAYSGGFVDDALSLLTDVILVIPTFPLIIVIAAYMKSASFWTHRLRAGGHRLELRRATAARPGAVACATATTCWRRGPAASRARTSSSSSSSRP